MSWAVMPMADYKAACDKVREKTNTTEIIKSGEMAEKVDEVYKAGQLSVMASSDALKGSASGEVVSIKDVSPVEHNVGVNLSSKNLFDYEKIIQKFVDNDFERVGSYSVTNIPLKPNTNYTVKINGEKNGAACFIASQKEVNYSTSTGISVSTNWTALEKVLTTDESGNLYIGLYPISAETRPAQFELAKVQIEEGTTASAYAPYVDDFSGVKVTVSGKNLLNVAEIVRRFNAGEYETDTELTNGYSIVDIQLKPNTEYRVKINGSQNGSNTFINTKKRSTPQVVLA